jgi:hypothetical protein
MDPSESAPSRLSFALMLGPSLTSSMAGDADSSCDETTSVGDGGETLAGCTKSPLALGAFLSARFNYEFLDRVAIDFSGGYLSLSRKLTRSLIATGNGPWLGRAISDETKLRAAFVLVGASRSFGEQFPVTLRLGAGLALGRLRARTSGKYESVLSPSPETASIQLEEDPKWRWIPLLQPEIRVGYQVTRHWSVDAGISAFLAFPASVTRTGDDIWGAALRRTPAALDSGGSQELTLPQENALGMMLIVLPSIGGRFEL